MCNNPKLKVGTDIFLIENGCRTRVKIIFCSEIKEGYMKELKQHVMWLKKKENR